MVKVAAPCLSLGASGSLGGAIVFSTWKGRPYVRELVKPANPKSALQVSMRQMMKFLSQRWDGMSTAQKADWEDRADDSVISPFNAFVGYNQKRWRNFQSPTKLDPGAEAGTQAAHSAWAATGGVRMITLGWTVDTANDGWGVIIHRSTILAADNVLSTVIALVQCSDTGNYEYVDSPLTAGTWYYDFRTFTDDGLKSGAVGEASAAAE